MPLTPGKPFPKIFASNIGKLIQSTRLSKGLNARECANELSITLNALSAIEEGRVLLSIYQWSRIAGLLNIPLDAFNYSFLDGEKPILLSSSKIEKGFLLPDRYRENRCFKIRELMPYFIYFIERCGWPQLEQWLRDIGISPSFIVNLDHQLNLWFVEDLVRFLRDFGLPEAETHMIGDNAAHPEVHGRLWPHYATVRDPLSRIQEYVNRSLYYQCAFEYSIRDRTRSHLLLQIRPEPFLEPVLHKFDAYTLSYIDQIREASLVAIGLTANLPYENPKSVRLRELESIYRESDRTLYEIEVA